MKKLLALSSVLALAGTFSSQAVSNELSYNFISGSYVSVSADDDDDLAPSGYAVSASRLLNENVFLAASYSSISDDMRVCYWHCVSAEMSFNDLQFGAGFRSAINETTDVYFMASFVKLEAEVSYRSDSETESANGQSLAVGLRTMVSPELEFHGSISKTFIEDVSETGFGAGFDYYINEKFTLGMSYSTAEDVNGYSLTARYHY